MNKWREGEYISKECKACKIISYCGGDCRLNNQRFNSKPFRLNKDCDIVINGSKAEILFDKELMYKFNKKTNIREEKFGAVISLGNNEFYVKQNTYLIIQHIRNKQIFDIKEMEKIVEINDALLVLLNKLVQAEIIFT